MKWIEVDKSLSIRLIYLKVINFYVIWDALSDIYMWINQLWLDKNSLELSSRRIEKFYSPFSGIILKKSEKINEISTKLLQQWLYAALCTN